MIRAILFDMDGLLFDTERMAGRMLNAATQQQGITLTDAQWTQMLSRSLKDINKMLAEWFGDAIDLPRFATDWYNVTLDHMRAHGMPVKDGAAELLPALRARGLKLAICTSNMDKVVREYLAIAGWTELFDEIVAGDKLARFKPDPEVYLTAAARLGVDPTECVGVEDSVSGVKAIRAAGMTSVMVPDVFPYTDALAPYVDHCLTSLTEFEHAIFDKELTTMTVKERFLRYVQVETTSDQNSPSCPSTAGQMTLANMLVDEMKALGIADARVDENGYAYGTIPAKGDHPAKVGLIAHMDTSDGVAGPTRPQIIPNYDGKAITLANGVVIDGFDFLPDLAGHELIVTSGDSVLGADDKAGVAEIMTLAERLMAPDAPEHCTVCIAFTPDEEIGRGADKFDVPGFGADYGYTVDGGALGELEYENFNAATMILTVNGVNIHPGSAKNQMKNAALLAMEWNALLPAAEIPACTEGYEGFFHLCGMQGNEEKATLVYIIRDHDADKFAHRKALAEKINELMNLRWGKGTFDLQIRDSYRNMREKVEPHMYIVDKARAAFDACGVKPLVQPIRGGTDGATLSFMGLPCPNLSTGGYNFHGRKELITVEAMEKMVDVLAEIVKNA